MLIIDENLKYFLYYGNIQNWDTDFGKKEIGVVDELGSCTSHILDI